MPHSAAHDALLAGLRQLRQRRIGMFVAGLLALLLLALAATGLGSQTLNPAQVLRALLARWLAPGWAGGLSPGQITLVHDLRLPRTLMALVCGAGLAMAGVALQGITRNPLVSPYTLGVSPAAALGASVAILLGLAARPDSGPWWTVGLAFGSALVCAALVLGLAALREVSALVLVLAGVALTYLFGALTAALQFIASEQQLVAIIHWTFGSLNGRSWQELAVTTTVWLLCAPWLLAQAWALNALAAGGDDVAASLGFRVQRVRLIVTLAAVLSSAAIVAFCGVIGFVGLVAPHIARMAIGGDHRVLLPFAALCGALLVLLSDLIGRLLFAPVVVPVGIVVAFVGVPLFLHLLLTRRHEVV